jgi:tryptophan-rich sensory protein
VDPTQPRLWPCKPQQPPHTLHVLCPFVAHVPLLTGHAAAFHELSFEWVTWRGVLKPEAPLVLQVWPLLYVGQGVSSWLVWKKGEWVGTTMCLGCMSRSGILIPGVLWCTTFRHGDKSMYNFRYTVPARIYCSAPPPLGAGQERRLPLALYGVQLVLNLIWQPIMFTAHRPDIALVDSAGQ